jgi:hypothetical protein
MNLIVGRANQDCNDYTWAWPNVAMVSSSGSFSMAFFDDVKAGDWYRVIDITCAKEFFRFEVAADRASTWVDSRQTQYVFDVKITLSGVVGKTRTTSATRTITTSFTTTTKTLTTEPVVEEPLGAALVGTSGYRSQLDVVSLITNRSNFNRTTNSSASSMGTITATSSFPAPFSTLFGQWTVSCTSSVLPISGTACPTACNTQYLKDR